MGKDRTWRIAGSRNALTDHHHALQSEHVDRPTLLRHLRQVAAAYPAARRIFIVLDNWPVHFRPPVLQGLAGHRLRLLPLPTDAPWTNPEEQVWRKLYAECLHLHDGAARWPDFKQEVQTWLDRLTDDPGALLRYVDLCPP